MQKRNNRILLILSVMLFTFTSQVFSTGQTEAESSEGPEESYMRLAWWGNPVRDEKTIAVANLYMANNPSVTIETETTGWGGYWDRINTQVASASLPDIMQHDYAYMLQFVQRNILTDLTPYVDSGVIDLGNVNETFLSGGRVDGKLYGISLGTNAFSLVYDTAVFEAAGIAEPDFTSWTWADFEEIAIEIFEKTGVQTMPLSTTDPKVLFDNMIRQTGASTYAKDGKSLGFTDTTVLKEYFNVQLRLLEAGVLVNPEVAFVTVTAEEGQLAKGNVWCDYIWSNQLASTQAVSENPLKMVLLPKIKNAKRPGTFLKPSMFFSIPASAENPDEAARYLNFFLNDSAANDILAAERGVPIPSDVREALKASASDLNKIVFDYIGVVAENSSPIDPPDPKSSGEFLKMFRDSTQEILMGIISVDQGVAKIMEEGNAILAK
ncbi:ABC transporter substrate-binding protein [Oceanispirochaeta sp.]|uniref:ABC transporter substrate-binding protein n=1 Tax=Oceanispirochaeta sp. TaxID=2035350 RepID=UPI00260C8BB1|nr:extracellular solute-binding protein [Oceanispirochaeta sp.]MDA3959093.1 extracellular solute-binding protein [Oceanispirochaeta sp.]